MEKYYKLSNLGNGTPFIFRSRTPFRDMYLMKAGDSRCVVAGERRTETGWEKFEDSCAPASEVYHDSSRPNAEFYEDGSVRLPSKTNNEQIIEQENEDHTDMQRGRKRIHNIALPINEDFTVAGIAATLGIEKYVVNNELARIQRETPDRLTKGASVQGGRGKPATVFKLLS